ncbi:MAG: hypothetical protein IJK04_13375 [Kiritimatiellae bacterium]|nr:hypothetical protein [Kiritimatiellia bacterium]
MFSLKLYFDWKILPPFSCFCGKKRRQDPEKALFLFTRLFFSCKFHLAFEKHSVSKFPVCRALRDGRYRNGMMEHAEGQSEPMPGPKP